MKKLFFLLAIASTLASCNMVEYYRAPEIIMLQSTDSSDVFQVSATERPDTLFEDVFPLIKETGETRSFVMWHSNWDGSEEHKIFPVYRVEVPYASCEERARSFYEGHMISYLQEQLAHWGDQPGTPEEVIGQLLHGISEGDYIPWEEVNFPK